MRIRSDSYAPNVHSITRQCSADFKMRKKLVDEILDAEDSDEAILAAAKRIHGRAR